MMFRIIFFLSILFCFVNPCESAMPIQRAPYGSWISPITTDLIVKDVNFLGDLSADRDVIYWSEMHPSEKGRTTVYRLDKGKIEEMTPAPYNVRSSVHEYGGGAFLAAHGNLFFVNEQDGRIYRRDVSGNISPITPEKKNRRYADFSVDPKLKFLVGVREEHVAQEVINTIVKIDLKSGEETVIASGDDFYSSPRVNEAGTKVAFISWNHPNMPWDHVSLSVITLSTGEKEVIAQSDESIYQPLWSSDGTLYFVSDRSGFWNLYRWKKGVEALYPKAAEFGLPAWVFGRPTFALTEIDGKECIVCVFSEQGIDHLAILYLNERRFKKIPLPFNVFRSVFAYHHQIYFIAASPIEASAVIIYDLDQEKYQVIQKSMKVDIDPAFISLPEPITFPTDDGGLAYGFFYPPTNPHFIGEKKELPPLIVRCHGGPTAQATPGFSLEIQFWTSRGLALLDVNYGGSTGYGRDYRNRLKGSWGIRDVQDAIDGALFLVKEKKVDPKRMAIKGASSGGYTTLCALAFSNVFKGGVSYFGVSDPELLVKDTHKFEAKYLDGLIGLYPERRDLYDARSPLLHAQQIHSSLLLLQGTDDPIVPVNQAQKMYDVLKANGRDVTLILLEGEKHGFKKSENIKRAYAAELQFYGKIFNFKPHD